MREPELPPVPEAPLWSEKEYTAYLDCERHLCAWALKRYGGYSEEDATNASMARYPCEPPSTEFRGLIFHWTAWFFAMEKIHGEFFWMKQPELEGETPEFEQEADRIYRSRQGGPEDID